MKKPGKLYLVGTPIGNLQEMTPRAIETLKSVNLIAAEDTRNSRKLCNHFSITRPLTSYHKHNEQEKSKELLEYLLAGNDLALISDAGMPGISDPSEVLVRKAIGHSIEVLAVGSGSALTHALVVSGLKSQPFTFLGFLPKDKGQKRKVLHSYDQRPETLIIYVSPHAVANDLSYCQSVLGNRQASLSREMTKWYEETRRGKLSEIIGWVKAEKPKGEMVLVVAGGEKTSTPLDESQKMVQALLDEGMKLKGACHFVAGQTGASKRELYNQALKDKKEN